MSPRLSVYLDPDLMAQLAELATRRNESLSLIVEAAMASFLKADEAHRREAAIMRRLDRLAREIKRLKRDLATYVETLAPLTQFLLTVTPPSPDGAGTGGQLRGSDRLQASVETLGLQLAKGRTLVESA